MGASDLAIRHLYPTLYRQKCLYFPKNVIPWAFGLWLIRCLVTVVKARQVALSVTKRISHQRSIRHGNVILR